MFQARKTQTRSGKSRRAASKRPQTVPTRIGRLIKVGTSEWGKPLVQCPQCGGKATTGRTGEVWCSECGFATAALSGCG